MEKIITKNLLPGRSYRVRATGVDSEGKTITSQVYILKTKGKSQAPPNVTNLDADFKGATLVVTWNGDAARAEKDFKHFRIKITSPNHSGVTKNYFTDSNVFKFQEDQNRSAFSQFEKDINITVYSIDRTGNQSSGVSISESAEPPSDPTNVKLTAATLGYNVSWDLPTFENYKNTRVYHSNTENGTYTLARTEYGSSTYVPLNNFDAKWVKVAHVNTAGVESNRVASVPPSVIPIDPVPTDVTPPAVPTNLNFEAVGTESVNGLTTATMRAHWEVSELASGYKVRVTEDVTTKTNWEVYDVPASRATVTNKQLVSGTATLTLSAHSFSVDDYVTVFNVDATFNGKRKITAVVPNVSISFAISGADVASTPSAGDVVISSYTIKDLYPGTSYLGSILAYDSANNITQFVAEGPFTTPGSPSTVGSALTISGTTMGFGPNVGPGGADGLFIDADNYWYNTGYFNAGSATNSISWNGTSFRVDGSINARSGSFSGNVFLIGEDMASSETDDTASLISAPFYSIQSASWNSGTATVVLSTTPSPAWEVGDIIVISQASRDFDGQYTILTISGATITFLMSSTSINVPSITNKGKITNVNGPDRVIFNSYGLQGFEDNSLTFSLNRDKKSQIGGWRIGKTKLSYSVAGDASRTVGLNSSSTSTVRIWAGAEEPGQAPFRVYETGNIRAYGVFSSSAADSGTRVAIGSDVVASKDGLILDDTSESGYENFWYVPSTVSNGNNFFQVGTLDGSAISVRKDSQTGLPKVQIKDYSIVGVAKIIDQSSISIVGISEAIDLIKIGKNVDPRTGFGGRDGISINTNNFWTLNNDGSNVNFRVGDTSNNYLYWDGSTLTVSGNINITGGNAATTGYANTVAGNAAASVNIVSKWNNDAQVVGISLHQYGHIYSYGKGSFQNDTDGWFLGWDSINPVQGRKPVLYIGNATNHLKWNGTDLIVNGKIAGVSGSGSLSTQIGGVISYSDSQYINFVSGNTLMAVMNANNNNALNISGLSTTEPVTLQSQNNVIITAVAGVKIFAPKLASAGRFLSSDGDGGNVRWSTAVTSVGLAAPTGFNVSNNSPIESSGTLTLSFGTAPAFSVLRSIGSTGDTAVNWGKINGQHLNYSLNNTSASYFIRVDNTGQNAIYFSTSATPPSSLRFKKITSQQIVSDSSWLDYVTPIKFKYNVDIENFGEDDAREMVGLIAEELSDNETLNQIVAYDDIGPEGVDYDKLAVLLIPVIKELRDKLNNIESRLDQAGI